MRSFLVFVMLVASGSGPAAAQQSIAPFQGQVVAFTPNPAESVAGFGDLAPGCGGDRFGGAVFDSAVIDGAGRAFFRAKLVSNTGGTLPNNVNFAYFVGTNRNDLVKVLRGGEPEPSGMITNALVETSTGGNGLATLQPRISETGTMMFGASLWDPTTLTINTLNDTALFVGAPGNFQVLAREGDVAPGTGGAVYNSTFSSLATQTSCINAAGTALFMASLTNTPPANNAAWFTGTPGSLQVALRKGDLLTNGEQILTLENLSQMNALGQFVTAVTLLIGSGSPAVVEANNRAVLVYAPGVGIRVLAREGDPVPGIPGTFYAAASNFVNVYGTGATTFNASPQFFDEVLLSGAGVVAGVNDRALLVQQFAGPASTVVNNTVVLRRGNLASGVQVANPGAVFDLVSTATMCLNDAGRVAFAASMTGGGVTAANDTAIWTGLPGNLVLVAREGDVAPGTGGLTFGNLTNLTMQMNAKGQILFQSSVGGNPSFWTWDPVVGVQCVTRNGDSIEVQPGVFKTSSGSTGWAQFTNGDTRPLSFANDGTVSLKVSMTDNATVLGTTYAGSVIVNVRIGSLTGAPAKISEAFGGTHNLYLNAGAGNAGLIFAVAGSASGTAPGTPIGIFNIPLNIDIYTTFTLQSANVLPFVNTFSTFNADGRALAQLVIPPGLSGLVGLVVHHAYGVIDMSGNLVFASEAARLEIVP